MTDDPRDPNDQPTFVVGTSSSTGGDWSATRSGSHLPIDMLLGKRYRILQLLGQGGMGAVYKAQDLELDRVIALKTIRPDLEENPELLQRFKHELILARQVTHRNVIRIYDIGEADGVRFITMDYIEGEDLRTYLQRRQKLPVREAVEIVLQICRGLDAAHAEGVVHRDLKPQNCVRQSNGRILVMDFGLARSIETQGMTVTGAMLGTLEYMSPEQASGGKVGPQSDLFTVGIIFYQLLTGILPYKAESAIASLILRSQERAKPPREIDPQIPITIDRIVQKCLEPNVNNRYQSAAEIIRDLDSWNNGQETVVHLPRQQRQTTRRSAPWPWIAGIALLLIVAATGFYWHSQRSGNTAAGHKTITLLVADFDNKTNDAVFDGTLEPAFTVAMEGASFVNSFSRNQAHKIASQIKPGTQTLDTPLAQLVAAREGVDIVVGGSVEKSGNGYTVAVQAYDPVAGKQISQQRQQVENKSEVLPAVNELAASLRKELGDKSIQSAKAFAAETYTASSVEAAHEYALGQDARIAGKFDEALQHYQQALKLDPEMGRAYAGIAIVYQNLGDRAKSEENYKLAMARLNRMTDREKYRTRGGYYLVTRNSQKGLEEMEALVRDYPSDSAGVANLALAYFYRRDMDKALELGKKSVEISPKNLPQRNNLGLYAMYAGKFPQAIEEQKRVLEMNPNFALAYVGIALSQLGLEHPDEARETYKKLGALGDKQASTAALGDADVSLYQGKFRQAISELQNGIAADTARKDQSSVAAKQIMLAQAYLSAGKKAEAAAAAKEAAKASTEDAPQIAAARIFAATGHANNAEEIAAKLATRIDSDPQAYAEIIRGEIQLAKGDPAGAITSFTKGKQVADTWLGHFDLGLAYLASNAYTEANSEFETCERRIGETAALFLDESPTMHLAPAIYYYLGRSQEGLNQPAAKASYRHFLDLTKDGDASDIVADAKRRVAAK